MKKLIVVLLVLFTGLSVQAQQYPISADTVRIYKKNGNGELRVENSSRVDKGIAVNVDGKGTLRWIKSRVLNDSTILVGLDTLRIKGSGGSTTITAVNGLNKIGSNIRLGGTLDANTAIVAPSDYLFSIRGSGDNGSADFTFNSEGLKLIPVGGSLGSPILALWKDGRIFSSAYKNNPAEDSVITTDMSGNFKLVAVKSLNLINLYTTDGQLTSNRVVAAGGQFSLLLDDLTQFRVNTANQTLRFDAYKNNAEGDSVLTTDIDGNLRLVKVSAGAPLTLQQITDNGNTTNNALVVTGKNSATTAAGISVSNDPVGSGGVGGTIKQQDGSGSVGPLYVSGQPLTLNDLAVFNGDSVIVKANKFRIAPSNNGQGIYFNGYKDATGDSVLSTDADGKMILRSMPASILAANGLHKDVNTIKLGGTLTDSTVIDANKNWLQFKDEEATGDTASFSFGKVKFYGIYDVPGNELKIKGASGLTTSYQQSDQVHMFQVISPDSPPSVVTTVSIASSGINMQTNSQTGIGLGSISHTAGNTNTRNQLILQGGDEGSSSEARLDHFPDTEADNGAATYLSLRDRNFNMGSGYTEVQGTDTSINLYTDGTILHKKTKVYINYAVGSGSTPWMEQDTTAVQIGSRLSTDPVTMLPDTANRILKVWGRTVGHPAVLPDEYVTLSQLGGGGDNSYTKQASDSLFKKNNYVDQLDSTLRLADKDDYYSYYKSSSNKALALYTYKDGGYLYIGANYTGGYSVEYRLESKGVDTIFLFNSAYMGPTVSKPQSVTLQGTFSTTTANSYTTHVDDKFTFNYSGRGFYYWSWLDNRGGIWRFTIDGKDSTDISTYNATNAEKYYGLFANATDSAHTVVAKFMGADPDNPPSGGTARGWIKYSATSAITVLPMSDRGFLLKSSSSFNIAAPEKIIVVPVGTIEEFALHVKNPNDATASHWVPVHDGTYGATRKVNSYLYTDDGLFKPNASVASFKDTLLNQTSIVLKQTFTAYNASDASGTYPLWDGALTHKMTLDDQMVVGKDFDFKYDSVSMDAGYLGMHAGKFPTVNKFLYADTSIVLAAPATETDIYLPKLRNTATYIDTIGGSFVAFKTNLYDAIHNSISPLAANKPQVFLQERPDGLTKLYYQIKEDNVGFKKGEKFIVTNNYYIGRYFKFDTTKNNIFKRSNSYYSRDYFTKDESEATYAKKDSLNVQDLQRVVARGNSTGLPIVANGGIEATDAVKIGFNSPGFVQANRSITMYGLKSDSSNVSSILFKRYDNHMVGDVGDISPNNDNMQMIAYNGHDLSLASSTAYTIDTPVITNIVVKGITGNIGLHTTTPTAQLHAVGSVRLDLGSDDRFDMFYRDSATNLLARIPRGTSGQILAAGAGGRPTWKNESTDFYTTNGTLTGNRTVTMNAYGLAFSSNNDASNFYYSKNGSTSSTSLAVLTGQTAISQVDKTNNLNSNIDLEPTSISLSSTETVGLTGSRFIMDRNSFAFWHLGVGDVTPINEIALDGTMTGSPADAANKFVTRQQVTDSLTARTFTPSRTTTTGGNISIYDRVIYVDNVGTVLLDLPPAASAEGQTITVKKVSSTNSINAITVSSNTAPATTEPIDGAADYSMGSSVNYCAVTLHCDGVKWNILSVYEGTTIP